MTSTEPVSDFSQFALRPELQAAIAKMGFTTPTPIQTEVIPHLLGEEPRDLVALAQTGSGKTAAFGIPMVGKLDASLNQVQALILSPTRELAAQIQESLAPFAEALDLRVLTIYGGTSYDVQRQKLKRTPQIIIATPGRLVDMMNQKLIKLSALKVLVLDEADRMLSMGFEDDLKFILSSTHAELKNVDSGRASCQTWLFSATMSMGIKNILNRYLTTPKIVEQVQKNHGFSTSLTHHYVAVRSGHRSDALLRILKTTKEFYGIVFCQTKLEVAELEQLLLNNKIQCMSLHGDKLQRDRERILKALKDEKFSVLIATDVAARGIDVKNLTHVIHYSIPLEIESYVHRSGRTGRNGEAGMVISIIQASDFSKLNRLVRMTKVDMQPFAIKKGADLLKDQIVEDLNRLKAKPFSGTHFNNLKSIIEETMPTLELAGLTTPSDWIAALLSMKTSEGGNQHSDSFLMSDFSLTGGKSKGNSYGNSRGGGRDRDRGFRSDAPAGSGSGRGGYGRDRGPREDRGYSSNAPAGSGGGDRPRRSFGRDRDEGAQRSGGFESGGVRRSFNRDHNENRDSQPQREQRDGERSFAQAIEEGERPQRRARSFDGPPRSFDGAPRRLRGDSFERGTGGGRPPFKPKFNRSGRAPSANV